MPRCTCIDWLETELPCKHIFHCLKVQQMSWNDLPEVLRKEHLRHRLLFKSKHKRGFFHRRCIIPLYQTKSRKVRQAQASRFGRQSGQEAKEVDSDENMEIVEEAEKLAKESPFIDLEAYKGQDDRQAKSLGTPGLFTPSHILAHFCMCVC